MKDQERHCGQYCAHKSQQACMLGTSRQPWRKAPGKSMATFGPLGKQMSVSVLQVAAAADLAERRSAAIDSCTDVHHRKLCM